MWRTGHYFAYGFNCDLLPAAPSPGLSLPEPLPERWLHFNDQHVKVTSWDAWTQATRKSLTDSPYLLFYKRLLPPQPTADLALAARRRAGPPVMPALIHAVEAANTEALEALAARTSSGQYRLQVLATVCQRLGLLSPSSGRPAVTGAAWTAVLTLAAEAPGALAVAEYKSASGEPWEVVACRQCQAAVPAESLDLHMASHEQALRRRPSADSTSAPGGGV